MDKAILGPERVASKLLALLLLAAGCSDCESAADLNRYQAEAVWVYHERVVERAIATRSTHPSFSAASDFFKELTGIEIRGDGSYFGWHATDETKEDLSRLREWFENNRARLRWSSESGQLGAD